MNNRKPMNRPPLYYPELPLSDLLRHASEKLADKYAIVYPSRITFREFWSYVDNLADNLAKMGVSKGDKVLIFDRNNVEYEIASMGAISAGAVLVPLNPMYKEREIKRTAKDAEAHTIFVRDQLYQTIDRSQIELENIIVMGREIPGTVSFSELVDKPANPPNIEIDPKEDLCILIYTSSTTGLPKGVMLTHFSVGANIIQFLSALEIGESDTTLIVLPLYHIFALSAGMLCSLYTGASQVLMKEFHRREFCSLIEKYGVRVIPMVPPIFIALINYPDLAKYDLSSLRFVYNSAAPVAPAVAKKFEKRTGVTVTHKWGLTEASPNVAANPWIKVKIESQGIPLSDTEHKVIDPISGKELPIGDVGELIIKGPQLMKGYWRSPEETEKAFITIDSERWLRTGDLARIDEEGYEYLVDRLKDLIKYKGYSVSPFEVESVLLEHPLITDCAVVGKPDPFAGEIPKVYIVPKEGSKPIAKEVLNFTKERLADYKVPREVEIIDSIPRTASGKILRRVLKEKERGISPRK